MKRDFYQTLLNWKESTSETPLMVVGARQVGKTYIIDKFCKENFKDYIYLNLMYAPKIIEIFKQNNNMEDTIKIFQLEINHKIAEDTIIFIDEVQESEEIISAMKYFAESTFPYKIIIAGSLLGVKLKEFKKSFPVGKVIISYMYPMNFKEFLIAIDKAPYIPLIEESYNSNKPINEVIHKDLLKDFQNYLYTGGMPVMVKKFIDEKGLIIGEMPILKSIIEAYIADMKKYTNNVYETNKIERIYKNIPAQLAKENRKYQFSKLSKNARFRDYETAFEWLLASKLIIPCYYVNRFETPLKGFMDSDNFKIYLSDVGLLTEMLEIPYANIALDNNFMYKGAIAENYVATELTKNGISLFYYQIPQIMEIDFLIDTSYGIIPIEVKASENVKSKSLNKFMNDNKLQMGIRISTKNFGFENNIKSVPLYATFCIKNK